MKNENWKFQDVQQQRGIGNEEWELHCLNEIQLEDKESSSFFRIRWRFLGCVKQLIPWAVWRPLCSYDGYTAINSLLMTLCGLEDDTVCPDAPEWLDDDPVWSWWWPCVVLMIPWAVWRPLCSYDGFTAIDSLLMTLCGLEDDTVCPDDPVWSWWWPCVVLIMTNVVLRMAMWALKQCWSWGYMID